MKKSILYLASIFLAIFGLWQMKNVVFAEQSGSSPESGSTSHITEAYEWLVAKGTNYGSTDAADWTNSWGTYWNRIMEAAAWEPNGTATAALVPTGLTFYAGDGDRTIKTGTLFTSWEHQDYDDANCTNNNGESATACGASDSEYTGEEGTWTLTASGGTAASVTDNSVTATLTSNKVYQDSRTKLYWTDRSTAAMDNEFALVDGDSRVSPTGNSCNIAATGTANSFCDNQDPLNAYTEDNDVSAAEFCLNLSLDADNADADNNGQTGTETDWRLPTQKEQMVAYANGAGNNLPTTGNVEASSTEDSTSQSSAWRTTLSNGTVSTTTKGTQVFFVRCVRR